ncbi:MAG: cell division protein ZapA [Firmicutes bacterium]|nr:cell division protein ZapA [Clostridiales bacterium]MBQ9931344.1 cell division protein ZapA [Bacillota bacterium]
MDKQNRVVVKIYGQEYTISGDQPSEHIIRVADYVDGKMTELAKSLPGVPAASVAALAAVNIADDYFGSIKIANEVRAQMAQLEREKNQYADLLEEAKKNYIQYKEEARNYAVQLENVRNNGSQKDADLLELKARLQSAEDRNQALQAKLDDYNQRMVDWESNRDTSAAVVKDLEAKCKEMETSFFDLQMENIQLKGELDRYKKIVE